jgi:hypothetical protein
MLSERAQDEFEVVGMDEVEGRSPGVLVQGVPEHRFGPPVAPEHLALGIEDEDDIG